MYPVPVQLWTEFLCPPQTHMLEPRPQGSGACRWGLWEEIKVR